MWARDGVAGEVVRGATLFAGLGGALGGVAGTVVWPVVGTFFGAVEGAVVGAGAGTLCAAALTLVAGWTRSRWVARGISSVVAGMAATAFAAAADGLAGLPRTVAAALIVAAALGGGAFGPLIAHGTEPVAGGPPATGQLQRLAGLILAAGAVLGAAAGLICGLVIGLRAYPPTAPFAAVEGGVLGLVSGLVLACLAVGAAVLPRLRARR